MRAVFLIIVVLSLTACSSTVPERDPASFDNDFIYGEISWPLSSVRIFPPEVDQGLYRYFFYVQLKDEAGGYVDCDPQNILLKNRSNRKLKYSVERFLRGRYYLTFEASAEVAMEELDFSVNGKILKEQFKLILKQPDSKNSKITVLHENQYKLRLQLFLGDSSFRPVQIPSVPDFNVEGAALIENVENVGDGVWEFDLILPAHNDIIYVSIRAHGTYLEKIFRFHHIEK